MRQPHGQRRRLLAPLSVALASSVVCGLARAEEAARLVYDVAPGAESCGGEAVLREAVTRRLGYDPFTGTASRTVIVHLEPSRRGFSGSVRLVDESGAKTDERTVRAPACDDVVLALALTASVALDPARALTPHQEPEAAPLLANSQPEPPTTSASIDRPRRVPWVSSGGVGGSLSTGDAPSLALGVLGYFAVRHGFLEAELDGRFIAPASVQTPLGPAVSWSLELDAAPCVHAAFFLGCAVIETGFVNAYADIASSKHAVGPLGRAGSRVGLIVPLGARFEGRILADGLLNMAPVTLKLSGVDVYRYATGLLRVSVAAGVRF